MFYASRSELRFKRYRHRKIITKSAKTTKNRKKKLDFYRAESAGPNRKKIKKKQNKKKQKKGAPGALPYGLGPTRPGGGRRLGLLALGLGALGGRPWAGLGGLGAPAHVRLEGGAGALPCPCLAAAAARRPADSGVGRGGARGRAAVAGEGAADPALPSPDLAGSSTGGATGAAAQRPEVGHLHGATVAGGAS